jgi:diacylglycerol diphosphate phosphatase/phosphatidate phosphatase
MDLARWKSNPTFRLVCSYLFDWAFCLLLLLLFFLLDNVEPFHREFSVENRAIMFPYTQNETIPVWALGLVVVAFPVVVIIAVGLGIRRSPYDVHNGILGLLVSVLLTTIFTQVIKVRGRGLDFHPLGRLEGVRNLTSSVCCTFGLACLA